MVMSVAGETQTSPTAVYFRYTVKRPIITTQISKLMFTVIFLNSAVDTAPSSREIRKKLLVPELVKKLPAFNGIIKFNVVFRTAYTAPSCNKPIQFPTCQPLPLKSILMLSLHLQLHFPSDVSSYGFPTVTCTRLWLLLQSHVPRPSHNSPFDYPNNVERSSSFYNCWSLSLLLPFSVLENTESVLSTNTSQLYKTVVMTAASGRTITVLTPVCWVRVACKSSEVGLSMELWWTRVTSETDTLTSVVCCRSDWCTEKCGKGRCWQQHWTTLRPTG